jgi:hypothetical protein
MRRSDERRELRSMNSADALGPALEAFIREHEYCGELDTGVEDDPVWMKCTGGAALFASRAVRARLQGGMQLIRLAVATFLALPSAG